MSELPPIELLCEIFDLVDGRLFWRVQRKGMTKPSVGLPAGHRHSDGYSVVSIDGRLHYEHRVIFAMTHGRWPVGEIDHRNMIRADNRPNNLREATRSQNNCNRKAYANSKSGIKGVCWDKTRRKWIASIAINRRQVMLGRYDDLELAVFIRQCAEEKYHGSFAKPVTDPVVPPAGTP